MYVSLTYNVCMYVSERTYIHTHMLSLRPSHYIQVPFDSVDQATKPSAWSLESKGSGVTRTLAARFFPELVNAYCLDVLSEKLHAWPKRLRNSEYCHSESDHMFKHWGLPAPPAADGMFDALERACYKSRGADVRQLSLYAFFCRGDVEVSGELDPAPKRQRLVANKAREQHWVISVSAQAPWLHPSGMLCSKRPGSY